MEMKIHFIIYACTIFQVNAQTIDIDDYKKVEKAEPSLEYVIAIYRHGTRAPLYFPYKNDYYKPDKDYFPEGKGHLTRAGKKLMFNVGIAIRARYGSFIDDGGKYNDMKVRFTSAPGSRNELSALLVSEGMFSEGLPYPDFDNESTYKRHKIPIHSKITRRFDKSYLVSKFPRHAAQCPFFSIQFTFNIINSLVLPNTAEVIEIAKYLTKNTGNKINSTVSFLNVWDRLECQRLNGLILPKWSLTVYPEKMLPIAVNNVRQTIAGDPLMIDLATGLFFKEIHTILKNSKSREWQEKIFLHSTHENMLYEIFFKMEVTNPVKIEVGDVMLIERHKYETGDRIKMYYYQPFYNTLKRLMVPGCEEENGCPMETFYSLTPEMNYRQWKIKCFTKSKSQLNFSQSLSNIGTFLKEFKQWVAYANKHA